MTTKNELVEDLEKLVIDIQEIPDGDVDRYLIIDAINQVIKENSS